MSFNNLSTAGISNTFCW